MDLPAQSGIAQKATVQTQPLFKDVEALYNQNRFVDAYRLCSAYFDDLSKINGLATGSIILLGRLARRLGGFDLHNRIFDIARDKSPDDPIVRYFAGHTQNANQNILLHLREMEKASLEAFETDSDKASWLGSAACIYALIRDFDTAHRHLDEAFSLDTERAWVHCCQAEVLCMEDRWQDALEHAEKAWEMSPGMPQGTVTLGRILAKKDGVGKAAQRLLEISRSTQSCESMATILWYLCADAERRSGPEACEIAEEARSLSGRLESLALLKDDHFTSTSAIIKTEIAWLLRDFDAMRSQNSVVEHPFYESVFRNIESARSSEVIIARHTPVFQKHNTCLPASVATVLTRFDRHIDVDALSEELTFSGTALWRMVDWLVERDFRVVAFTADVEITLKLLENGLPFVFCVKSVSQNHAMAAVGVDNAAGVLLVHDPGQARMEKYLLSELGGTEVPFGPEALAIVPKEDAHLLSLIPKSASEPYSAYLDYQRAVATKGNNAGFAVIGALRESCSDHPFLTRLEAIHSGRRGMAAAAIKRQLKLIREYPDCEHIRQELMHSLYQTNNTNLMRKVLAQLVLKKRMPGFSAAQKWQYVPAEYVAQFATYGAAMELGDTSVEKLLWEAIERDPVHAGCHHALGDCYSMKGDIPESILPYRCAAMLDLENHHYARAYLNALAKVGRLEKGKAFLEWRTGKLGTSLGGGEVWITLIQAFEDYGFPVEATTAMKRALAERPDDPYLLHWAVKFWARMADGERASDCLDTLKRSENTLLYHSAATDFHRTQGRWRRALRHCKRWLSEEPKNPDTLRQYVDLCAMAEGRFAALHLAEEWWTRNKGNDEIELIFLERLKELHEYDRQLDILRSRIKRNPYDVWAHRELGFLLLQVVDIGEHRDMAAIGKELENAIAACKQLAPDDAAISALEADWASYRGERQRAVTLYKKAISQDPAYGYAYQGVWSLSSRLPEDDRMALFKTLAKTMLLTSDFLYLAETLSKMAAESFGSTEAHRIVDQWLERYPKDPEVPKAKIALLLDYGQGRSDAQKAVTLIKSFIERFPYEPALKYGLSRAYRILQDDANWVKTSYAIVKQFPLSSIQRRQLSEYFQRKDEPSKAKDILYQGIHVRPLDTWLRHDLIALLFQLGEIDEAKALLDESFSIIPEDIAFRVRIVDLLFDYGEEALAVEMARAGTEIYPDGAALWKYYGDAVWRSNLTSDMKAVEEIYRKAMEFNPRFAEAADRLAQLLTNLNRFDEAKSIIHDQLPHHVQKGALLTRLAWIERRAGDKMEAIKQLVRVVKEWPTERWPWLLLIEWIGVDENWLLARSTLKNVHPVMDEDPDFVSDKLYLLHRAGEVDTQAEWERLLHNFPEHEKAHCLRFDILLDAAELDAAEKVLDTIEARLPTSPYLMARRVALKADQQDFNQAAQVAMKMFQLRYDVGQWCQGTVLQSFKNHNQLPLLISTAVDEWEKGTYIEPNCFKRIVDLVHLIWRTEMWFPRLCKMLGIFPEAIKRLRQMLEVAMQRDDQMGSYTAAILSRLDDYKQRNFLIEFAKRHTEIAQTKTAIWQIIGFAYVTGNKKEIEKARQWLAPWRYHDGCELWIVSNLIIAIERSRQLKLKQKLEQILKEAGDGLRTLPPDNLVQFVAAKYCEAALRLGQEDAFLAMARRYENVLRDSTTGYWCKPEERHLPWAIIQFLGLLTSDGCNVKALTKHFRSTAGSFIFKKWVLPEWKRWARRIRETGR